MLCPINLYRKRDKKHSSPSRQSGARLSPDNEKYSEESELWVGGEKDLALRLMSIISLLSPHQPFRSRPRSGRRHKSTYISTLVLHFLEIIPAPANAAIELEH